MVLGGIRTAQQAFDLFSRARTHWLGERGVANVATEADGVAHAVNERGAGAALGTVLLDRVACDRLELAIHVALDLIPYRRTADRSAHRSPNSLRSRVRARCNRVFTLASEMPVRDATSFVDNPSISRNTTMAR